MLYSVPSYPTTSFHTTPEYLAFLRDQGGLSSPSDPPARDGPDHRSTSSSHTLRMSYPFQHDGPSHPNVNPRVIHDQDDDGYPDEDGDMFLNSRIKGLEALQSPEPRHKVLPWLDDVPHGKRPDDERSFAGGSVRTGGILKPPRKQVPADMARPSPPPVAPPPASPRRAEVVGLASPLVSRPPPISHQREESESIADLLHQLDGTATDVSRLEREERQQRRPASGTVPSPFAAPGKEIGKTRSRTTDGNTRTISDAQARHPESSRSQQQDFTFGQTSRSSHRPERLPSPEPESPTSTMSFGNVDHPDRNSRRQTLPVKPVASMSESQVQRRLDETTHQLPPVLPSRPPQRVDTPPAVVILERDNDSTRTILPTIARDHPQQQSSTRQPVPSPLRHQRTPSQQLVRSSRAQSIATAAQRASLFHDKALCELLEASAQPGMGEEVKKVLRVAVERRVAELAREVSKQPGLGLQAGSTEHEQAPPAWAVDLSAKLDTNQARLEAILRSLPPSHSTSSSEPILFTANVAHRARSPNAYITPLSPISPTQDIPADNFPSSIRPLGTSLGLFTESPAAYDPPEDSLARRTFGDPVSTPTSDARAVYVAVDPTLFHPVGPPGASAASQSSGRDRREHATSVMPMAPQILVQAPSTNRSRTPVATPSGVATPVIVVEPVLPSSSQEVKAKDFADRDLPAIPPEVPSESEAGDELFAFKPPPVLDERDVRPRTPEGRAAGKRRELDVFSEDPILPTLPDPRPWDLVSQRLNAWAIIWTLDDFKKALEDISLGLQVNSFALTIWTTTTYKRQLRHRICSDPSEVVDKMMVPPSMGDALNQACYHKRFDDAKMIIEELWTPFNLPSVCPTGFPRIILALCRHRNENDTWAVHRFDLSSSTMRSFLFYAEGERKKLPDGRPFSWWHAIRAAYPNAGIKDPEGGEMGQKTDHIQLPPSATHEASLHAVNCWRNLLMGWRWDRPTDLPKLRELIWMETKRIMGRKAGGRLVGGDGGDV